MRSWQRALNADPLPWLLETDTPAVRHLALTRLLDEPEDSPKARRALGAAMRADPIATILANQEPEGWWVKPEAGYGPKYKSTVWSLMFLEQMGADSRDRRIRRACEYVLEHTQAPNGGFGWRATNAAVAHCLNGNLLRALIVFGYLDDPRVRASIDWETGAITDEDAPDYHPWATSGPGFGCGINGQLPCGWGAIKALRGLAAIPPRRRTRKVRNAIDQGAEFLLAHDMARADYPTATTISQNWFRFGFPSGYVADILQGLEVLAELKRIDDPRASGAIDLVLSMQDGDGRWHNRYGYRGKTWIDVDQPRATSKWVTLRACTVLRAALG